MSRLRFAFSALKLTDHGHSVVLRPSGRSECEPESHHNAWITLGCQTDKDGKYAITPPFFLIHENQTVLVQPRLLFATQRHALVRQTRLLQWAYIHGECRLGLHTLQRVFIYCIHFPYRSNCAHPWRRRGLLVISTAGNFRSSVSLSEWQINDRILPSACLWICISLDVFYVTPTAGRSSKCISLTTHNRKPPNSQWVVFKIIWDVSYVAVLKQWNLLAGIFFFLVRNRMIAADTNLKNAWKKLGFKRRERKTSGWTKSRAGPNSCRNFGWRKQRGRRGSSWSGGENTKFLATISLIALIQNVSPLPPQFVLPPTKWAWRRKREEAHKKVARPLSVWWI